MGLGLLAVLCVDHEIDPIERPQQQRHHRCQNVFTCPARFAKAEERHQKGRNAESKPHDQEYQPGWRVVTLVVVVSASGVVVPHRLPEVPPPCFWIDINRIHLALLGIFSTHLLYNNENCAATSHPRWGCEIEQSSKKNALNDYTTFKVTVILQMPSYVLRIELGVLSLTY